MEEIFEGAAIEFECPDEARPFHFLIKIEVDNSLIPLEGPLDADSEFKKELVGIVVDITDCTAVATYGYKWCLEFRGTESSKSSSFYKAFNDLTQILDEISTTLNNEEE